MNKVMSSSVIETISSGRLLQSVVFDMMEKEEHDYLMLFYPVPLRYMNR